MFYWTNTGALLNVLYQIAFSKFSTRPTFLFPAECVCVWGGGFPLPFLSITRPLPLLITMYRVVFRAEV